MSYGPKPLRVSWKQPADGWGGAVLDDFWDPFFKRGEPIRALVVWPLVVTEGCECGLEAHEGSCEGALACEAVEREGCTCCGYWDPDTRTVEHDGFCELVPSPEGCECGLTWMHLNGCSHDGEPIAWPKCSCGCACTLGNGCLRAGAEPPPSCPWDCCCGLGCPSWMGCRARGDEDEHDGAHVFAGPCEAVA